MIKRNGKLKRRGNRTYHSWRAMMSRCYNTSNNRYYRYGDRGIKVCKRWHDFDNFYEDMGQPPVGLQLDRINNDKGYSKNNCRWVTPRENSRNRSSNRKFLYKGKNRTLIEISEMTGLGYKALSARLFKLKWTIKEATSRGIDKGNNGYSYNKDKVRRRKNNRLFKFNGKMMTLSEIGKIIGVKESTIRTRITAGRESLDYATSRLAYGK